MFLMTLENSKNIQQNNFLLQLKFGLKDYIIACCQIKMKSFNYDNKKLL